MPKSNRKKKRLIKRSDARVESQRERSLSSILHDNMVRENIEMDYLRDKDAYVC